MSEKEKNLDEGYAPFKKGYQPGHATDGHKPEKTEVTPTNPPKKK